MKRGEIYWSIVEPRSGSELRGRRPSIIVSHDGFNEIATWQSVIVVPVSTSAAQGRRGPTVVPLAAGTGGLSQDSFAVCHQVTALDRSKLAAKIGELPVDKLQELAGGLRAALELI